MAMYMKVVKEEIERKTGTKRTTKEGNIESK